MMSDLGRLAQWRTENPLETQLPDLSGVMMTDLAHASDEQTMAALNWVIGQCDRTPSVCAGGGEPGGGAERIG
jgi:hypothetical protein